MGPFADVKKIGDSLATRSWLDLPHRAIGSHPPGSRRILPVAVMTFSEGISMFLSPPWSRLAVVVGLAVALGLTGCSASGPSTSVASIGGASSSAAAPGGSGQQPDTAEHDAMVKFAQCMRQHGVNMPDPPSNGAMAALPGVDPQKDPAGAAKAQAANAACEKDLPNGGKPSAQDVQKQLQFAQCMRQHGVDMPDPSANGGGAQLSINFNDPKTATALKACDPTMAGGVPSGG